MTNCSVENIFKLDGKVPLLHAFPVGLQHVLAMFVANITPIILLTSTLDKSLQAALIQNAMLIAGIGTLIQLFPVFFIGAKLPIVMGISFTFLSASFAISTTLGFGALMGAVIVGGIIEGILGLFAKYWLKFIPPVVSATVVTAIGFSLLGVGAASFGGGQGSADFGSYNNWIIGMVTLVSCLVFSFVLKGYLKSIAVLFGLIIGYILAVIMGAVDFSVLKDTSIVSIPRFLPFKPEFNIGAILSVTIIFLVSATETIGDTSALSNVSLLRSPTSKELSGAVTCDGFVSSISGLFGCTPITSFSQNVGLVGMTGVVNRFTIGTGALILIIASIFPIIGAFLTTIPQSVLGGCSIIMFGTILVAGFQMIARESFSRRNIIIISLSLAIGLGFTQTNAIFAPFPAIIKSVFAENCVALVFVVAVLLNIFLPKDKE